MKARVRLSRKSLFARKFPAERQKTATELRADHLAAAEGHRRFALA
jgi:hypothetical protein